MPGSSGWVFTTSAVRCMPSAITVRTRTPGCAVACSAAAAHRLRLIPDVEQHWCQAPGGDHRPDLYGKHYPGSDPDTVSRQLYDDAGVDYAILNPLTRGNIADYLLNTCICAAVNDWLLDRWLDPDHTNRYSDRSRGTIWVNPEDPKGAVAEIERLAGHPKLVQVGVPMQSREPYGKPMFEPIWEAAAAHSLPVAVHINGGNGVDHPPTFAGHAHTYPGYAAFMPLNYLVHLATLIVEGVFGRHPGLTFVFADGGYDILAPLMWRLDTFWLSMRDQTPWVDRYPGGGVDQRRAQAPELAAREIERWAGHRYMCQILMTPQIRGIPFGRPLSIPSTRPRRAMECRWPRI